MSIPDLLDEFVQLDPLGFMCCTACKATGLSKIDFQTSPFPGRACARSKVLRLEKDNSSNEDRWRVSCPCGVSGPWASTQTQAIAEWNHRPFVNALIVAMQAHFLIRNASFQMQTPYEIQCLCDRLKKNDMAVLDVLGSKA